MKNPNFAIMIYSVNKEPQGYLKRVSTFNYKIESTNNLVDAKKYAKEKTAQAEAQLVMAMTNAGLICEVVKLN